MHVKEYGLAEYFSADKVVLCLTYPESHPLLVEEIAELTQFADMFENNPKFLWGIMKENKIKYGAVVARLIVTNIKEVL